FGYGEIPWEFHVGARSWLLPGALAGFMWLGDRIADTPALYLGAAHLALAALAATSMLCAFFWGRRWFGFWGGLVAASLPALWPDAVYFGARSLSECVAAALLVPALYLLDGEVKRATGGRRFAGGALLDALTWTYPFQSLWLNFTYNAFNGAADSFGTAPWSYYLIGLIAQWRWY